MQQRRLRPGDVLDDYCPRERRITDHAIVAMIDDNIKQTRCVACDVEHGKQRPGAATAAEENAGALSPGSTVFAPHAAATPPRHPR